MMLGALTPDGATLWTAVAAAGGAVAAGIVAAVVSIRITNRSISAAAAAGDTQREHDRKLAAEALRQRRTEDTYLAALQLMERGNAIMQNTRSPGSGLTAKEMPAQVSFDENVAINTKLKLFGSNDTWGIYSRWWARMNGFTFRNAELDTMAGSPGAVPDVYPPNWTSTHRLLDGEREAGIALTEEFATLAKSEIENQAPAVQR